MPLTLLPLLIFVAEVCVVTISTVRIIFLSQRQKVLAMVIGIFEVSIWLFAIGKVMQNLSDPFCSIAFATGFAIGNYLGVVIEQKLAAPAISSCASSRTKMVRASSKV